MRSHALEHVVLGFAVLIALIWLDLIPTEMLREVAMVLLGWAAFSTLLVASAGAWVAYARARADAHPRPPPRQHLTTHRN